MEDETGGPAFPCAHMFADLDKATTGAARIEGMTLRQYAAIKLRVPESGTDWLDEMIRKARRDDFAAKAMQGLMSRNISDVRLEISSGEERGEKIAKSIAYESYFMADAMLKARQSL